MSVKIRLTKTGKRNQIQYRIVAQDTRTNRDGKFLAILGSFNPLAGNKNVTLNKEDYEAWVSKGAKPTPSVSYLLEFGKLPKKTKKVKIAAPASDQKPPEETQENTETPKAEETKPEVAEEPTAEPQPAEENANPIQDENSKTHDTQEESKPEPNN